MYWRWPPASGAFLFLTTVRPCRATFTVSWKEGESPGLILVPQVLAIGSAIEELHMVWACGEAEEFRNRVIYCLCSGSTRNPVRYTGPAKS